MSRRSLNRTNRIPCDSACGTWSECVCEPLEPQISLSSAARSGSRPFPWQPSFREGDQTGFEWTRLSTRVRSFRTMRGFRFPESQVPWLRHGAGPRGSWRVPLSGALLY